MLALRCWALAAVPAPLARAGCRARALRLASSQPPPLAASPAKPRRQAPPPAGSGVGIGIRIGAGAGAGGIGGGDVRAWLPWLALAAGCAGVAAGVVAAAGGAPSPASVFDFYAGPGAWAAAGLGGASGLAAAEAALEAALREALPAREGASAALAALLGTSADAGEAALAPTVVIIVDDLCLATPPGGVGAGAIGGDPRRAARPALRGSLVRALLALSESGCELVLASPQRSAAGAAALIAERLLPALADADRYRFTAFQRALRGALAAQYTAAHGGTPGAAATYAETWLATSPTETDERYARAVLHLTAVLGREHTLPRAGSSSSGGSGGSSGAGAARPPPRVLRLDLLPRPMGQVLLVDAAGGATARAFARNALVLPSAAATVERAAAGDEEGEGDSLLALGDLVALFKLAGEHAAADMQPPPGMPAWLDRLAGDSGQAACSCAAAAAGCDCALAARSRAALARAAQMTAAARAAAPATRG